MKTTHTQTHNGRKHVSPLGGVHNPQVMPPAQAGPVMQQPGAAASMSPELMAEIAQASGNK